ncbi:Fic family protein [uncultured Succinatimonas sp.]|uniref:Fic family protein n=1 Tax=uncultured Succinatimonas sp. TaxID=1262973 RepID=UPI0025D82380|nr:Fic family protein [uncultured Succinatimonas sp.]
MFDIGIFMVISDFEEYLRQGEPSSQDKINAWQTAIGLQSVDGLSPSQYLLDTARKHIDGDISIDEARDLIKSYYQSKSSRDLKFSETEEADKASANIAKILGENTFSFSLVGLLSIHQSIFDGIFKFSGKIRDYNITKKEWGGRGDTVLYVSAPDIKASIEYDLDKEKKFKFSGLSLRDIANHIARFTADLWQIHPFGEGNTRTTAVFIIKYLRSLGFKVENNLFVKNSWYFRNALVRANYQNLQLQIERNVEFLERFFQNLIAGTDFELKNRYLVINAPKTFLQEETKKSDQVPIKYRSSTDQVEPNTLVLLKMINTQQLSVKELMLQIGLKHRPTFFKNYLNPAIESGFVKVLYPEKLNHPRQKYLLTVKGAALLSSLKMDESL